MISELVKKCGRIKARFGPGGPENWPRTFSVATRQRERESGGRGPYRNWFCIFMKALLPEHTASPRLASTPPRFQFTVVESV